MTIVQRIQIFQLLKIEILKINTKITWLWSDCSPQRGLSSLIQVFDLCGWRTIQVPSSFINNICYFNILKYKKTTMKWLNFKLLPNHAKSSDSIKSCSQNWLEEVKHVLVKLLKSSCITCCRFKLICSPHSNHIFLFDLILITFVKEVDFHSKNQIYFQSLIFMKLF